MRRPGASLYWKIFLSFWLTSFLLILTTALVTGQIAQQSSIPAREQLFMDSYANAAVATYESGQKKALDQWLKQNGVSRHMHLYLLSDEGEILGPKAPPGDILTISENLVKDDLETGILKSGNLIVSHEIIASSGKAYRLVAVTEQPLAHFVEIPWGGLALRLGLATLFSGLVCYFLSVYLTRPLQSLGIAAQKLASGQLDARVGPLAGHRKDEIAELRNEFDRMAEQLENLVNSKQRLLQDISHELRSPLARLHVAIGLAARKTGTAASAELARMEQECIRLNTLIGEILEFSRLEKANGVLRTEPVFIPDLVQDIVDDTNYEFQSSPPRVETGPMIPCTLEMDKRLISRAAENIIRNAVKYSPASSPVVVSMTSQPGAVGILVEDCGEGVPEQELQHILDPFYRVDSSRTARTGGVGLGLSIAHQAVRLHHGRIEISNRPEGGLQVVIWLPE